MRNPQKKEDLERLKLKSLKHLALQIGIAENELTYVAEHLKNFYWMATRDISIEDGTKKVRNIYCAEPRLKRILKNINKLLLKRCKMLDCVHGARSGHSNITNASVHVGKKNVLKLDIMNFFPSVSNDRVFDLFFDTLKCSPEVAHLLTRLCTADYHLPQGFNTSPSIANMILQTVIRRIKGFCDKQGLNFTVYVDDITISGNKDISQFEPTIKKIIVESQFKIKSEKTCYLPNHKQQKVTGLIVNQKINIPKKYYEGTRGNLLDCKSNGPLSLLSRISLDSGKQITSVIKLKEYLHGKINYITQVNPISGAKLTDIFNSITWTRCKS